MEWYVFFGSFVNFLSETDLIWRATSQASLCSSCTSMYITYITSFTDLSPQSLCPMEYNGIHSLSPSHLVGLHKGSSTLLLQSQSWPGEPLGSVAGGLLILICSKKAIRNVILFQTEIQVYWVFGLGFLCKPACNLCQELWFWKAWTWSIKFLKEDLQKWRGEKILQADVKSKSSNPM